MEQKNEFGHEAQHVETNSIDAHDEKHGLEKVQTLAIVDVENKAAFKGDESDGKVEWNFKSLAAATFLCMLYTGKTRFQRNPDPADLLQARKSFSTSSVARCNSSHQTSRQQAHQYGSQCPTP